MGKSVKWGQISHCQERICRGDCMAAGKENTHPA